MSEHIFGERIKWRPVTTHVDYWSCGRGDCFSRHRTKETADNCQNPERLYRDSGYRDYVDGWSVEGREKYRLRHLINSLGPDVDSWPEKLKGFKK